MNPAEGKYRRLRLSNPRIEAALQSAPNALPALEALGWQSDPEDADFLVCPKSVKPSMAEVPPVFHIVWLQLYHTCTFQSFLLSEYGMFHGGRVSTIMRKNTHMWSSSSAKLSWRSEQRCSQNAHNRKSQLVL